ncbi:MAG: asparagine synthase-related protein [Pseudonocardiaceae bacterium]
MLESHLRVPNICWKADDFDPLDVESGMVVAPNEYADLTGRFATARQDGDRVLLTRDKLGLNKLFFAIDPVQGVVVANYLIDLVDGGIPFHAVYSVPAGATIEVNLGRREIAIHRHYSLPRTAGSRADPARVLKTIGERLNRHMELIAETFRDAKVVICLSGGADSGLVAAHAREHFPTAVAYTYTYADATLAPSEDAVFAEQLAAHLGLRFRLVKASPREVVTAVRRAICAGQDWRDFNVHCAIVNEILAGEIAADVAHDTQNHRTVVLTGDLMNEILGDYAPVRYRNTVYYQLPALNPDRLRISLVRGVQTGDREVGVFRSHGLDVVQLYALVVEELLQLPSSIVKADVVHALAGDRLPAQIYGRPKARAQIGDPEVRRGILPLLVDSGRNSRWLEDEFCDIFKVSDRSMLRRFIRAGVYRYPTCFPGSTHG